MNFSDAEDVWQLIYFGNSNTVHSRWTFSICLFWKSKSYFWSCY